VRLAALRWALWGVLGLLLIATFIAVRMSAPRIETTQAPPPELLELPAFELENRDGRQVSHLDLRGRVWVANFIFTRCALSCPRMTSQMMRLGSDLPEAVELMRISITVDPDYDTLEVLADYAGSYQIEDPDWMFLTGERNSIERLIVDGFKLPIVRDPPPEAVDPKEPILHSDRFALVDGRGRVRGYYDPADAVEYEKLLSDVVRVSEEIDVPKSPEALAAACAREIEELHAFFGRWFLAELPPTEAALARFSRALADDFSLIGPDGEEVGRREIIDRIRSAHGSRKPTGFEIWIEEIRPRAAPAGFCLMTYQEWQRFGQTTKVRLSSVLFRAKTTAPNGVEWLHLHETWLPVE
jgi:cytochrome oxidase Cu insertion factor (SCO1/SenC/PrrC family)